jgi:hypothetical protein
LSQYDEVVLEVVRKMRERMTLKCPVELVTVMLSKVNCETNVRNFDEAKSLLTKGVALLGADDNVSATIINGNVVEYDHMKIALVFFLFSYFLFIHSLLIFSFFNIPNKGFEMVCKSNLSNACSYW